MEHTQPESAVTEAHIGPLTLDELYAVKLVQAQGDYPAFLVREFNDLARFGFERRGVTNLKMRALANACLSALVHIGRLRRELAARTSEVEGARHMEKLAWEQRDLCQQRVDELLGEAMF